MEGGRGGGGGELISRPPQLSTVFRELRHAYMWLIEPGVRTVNGGWSVFSCVSVCVHYSLRTITYMGLLHYFSLNIIS